MTELVTDVTGMCQTTGKAISGIAHVRQSLSRIVMTNLGTRVQRRGFGTDLLSLVGAPANEATRVRTVAILAEAILRWEPRVKLSHINFSSAFDGKSKIEIHCAYKGEAIKETVAMGVPT